MPEKTLWTRHVGMESLNSVGSTGSCDSMESISSNHSAFSGDGYDHLSAEERECLMFLEETIDSLDNEEDSGVSNDELEMTEKSTSHLETEPIKVPVSDGNDQTKPVTTAFPKLEEWASVAKIPQGYHSFPRIVQASREETTKPTIDSNPPDSNLDQAKSWHGKPKSMTSINRPQMGEPYISEMIIPPPEPFRDPQVIIDKRRSVTDPTDARELRFDKVQLRPAAISEYKEVQTVVKPVSMPTPTLLPRVSSPKASASSQESVIQSQEKIVDLKQGPPTAPKPRTLPPHIIIKSSSGVVSNLDPQMRQRTFSAHDRIMADHREPAIPKVPHSKEQERARIEALQKLGLNVKSTSQENISMRSSKTDLTLAQGVGDQTQKDVNRKSDIYQQDRMDVMGTIPEQPPVINLKTVDGHVRNESVNRNRLSMKSNSLEKEEPVVDVPPQHSIKSTIFTSNRPNIKVNMQEKADNAVIQVPNLSNETHTVTETSPKNSEVDSVKYLPPSHSQQQPQSKAEIKSGYAVSEIDNGSNVPLKSPSKPDSDRKSSGLITNPVEKEMVIPEINPVRFRQSDNLSVGEKSKEKLGSSENIGFISTSPVKTFSFPRPKEVVDAKQSPEIIRVKRDDKVLDKSNRHSTHFEPLKEPYLRFPQGSVPGLRQINFKANTLERSGVGLSGSMSNIEKESQKSSSSFFKKPLFSGNFLRSSRPRPVSLGTGKDFANLETPTTDGDTTEKKRSFISRPSRSSAPITSVKITPKGSSEEHRKEALKKLGILKE